LYFPSSCFPPITDEQAITLITFVLLNCKKDPISTNCLFQHSNASIWSQ
jgi:hypothetical protein